MSTRDELNIDMVQFAYMLIVVPARKSSMKVVCVGAASTRMPPLITLDNAAPDWQLGGLERV